MEEEVFKNAFLLLSLYYSQVFYISLHVQLVYFILDYLIAPKKSLLVILIT